MSMRKIQVFLREDQKAALKSLSARTSQKQSDLIRKGVDLLIERATHEEVDWRAATRAAAGIWQDRTDLEDLSRKLRAAAKRRFATVYEPT
ncbi:MAG: ribbon-helix-helix domain-containing protein [Lysobacterales bacterium]